MLLAGDTVAGTASEKAALRAATGADALDLETGAALRAAHAAGLPFAALRAVCDPAERSLPPVALVALDAQGAIGIAAVLRALAREPGQIAGVLALAADAWAARRALRDRVRSLRAG